MVVVIPFDSIIHRLGFPLTFSHALGADAIRTADAPSVMLWCNLVGATFAAAMEATSHVTIRWAAGTCVFGVVRTHSCQAITMGWNPKFSLASTFGDCLGQKV